jgi:putative heme iron utilization protein
MSDQTPPEQPAWFNAVQTYLANHPNARAIDIAQALGCTEADALSLLSDEVWTIPGSALPQVLAEIRNWARVMVLIRNGDAVAEVEAPGDGWYQRGDWLNWIAEGYNLHIRVAATDHILALVRPGKHGPTYSFNLVNQAGQLFCRFYARTSVDQERLVTFCASYQKA